MNVSKMLPKILMRNRSKNCLKLNDGTNSKQKSTKSEHNKDKTE